MTANKPKTVWWVEPSHMPGVLKIRASAWHMSGHTVEVSRLVSQTQLDSAIVPRFLVGQIIFSMQSALNGVLITEHQ